MKKVLLIAALFTTATLFASGHGGGDVKCDIDYNHCMADCSIKYGSDTECVARCKTNYQNCKSGLHTQNYTAPKIAEKANAKESHKKENKHH